MPRTLEDEARDLLGRAGVPTPQLYSAGELVEIANLIGNERRLDVANDAMQDDLAEILRTMGLSDHARPESPHEVMQGVVLPELRKLVEKRDVIDIVLKRIEVRIDSLERSLRPPAGKEYHEYTPTGMAMPVAAGWERVPPEVEQVARELWIIDEESWAKAHPGYVVVPWNEADHTDHAEFRRNAQRVLELVERHRNS